MRTALVTGTLLLLAVAATFTANPPGEPQASATKNSGTALQDAAKQSSTTSPGAGKPATADRRKIPCKTAENASLCYWTHGRLSFWGTYAPWRIWKVGTQRLLRICNGPSHFPRHYNDDCTSPEFPANLRSIYDDARRWKLEPEMPFPWELEYFPPDVFADFEICPLEPAKKAKMQAVCIESATRIFVEE